MKKLIFLIIVLMIFCTGCINMYLRCPYTDVKIEDTYQSTVASFGMSYVIMFPQILNTTGDTNFVPMNLISVPIGSLCFIDVACEGIIDTICWPIDKMISNSRID